ncbi:c-type cytochrome biogenesis protein CcmI [Mangrovicella endophytica]|uniref:c-type cytochrome biogenesis protein CcmI n=1 Tax=Mangrovicella endophytica TaxID=2066697 RepID=UPI000C9E0C4C|nr:c-type cytochrome biogenesis protein CcmI [Mangrovicella endophytica]
MFFWVIAAALTALATIAALLPLLRSAAPARPAAAAHDAEVYRAQLGELNDDIARGTIAAFEAETARAEIGRRLLRASGKAAAEGASHGASRSTLIGATLAVVVLLPLSSIGLYAYLGSAGLPDLPLAERAAPSGGRDVASLVAQAEERLRTNPNDGQGWAVLAPIYLRMERPMDAERAFRNATRLLGATADREAGLGEALTQIAGGEVTDDARAAFERALALNASYLPARFFLALDLSQENRLDAALVAWQDLIDKSPAEAPWLPIANAAIADARQKRAAAGNGAPAQPPASIAQEAPAPGSTAAARGPTGEDIAAAADLSAGDRRAMIEGMVAQLASRLKTAPNDVEGWKRLIRSYTVLGEGEKAATAFGEAKASFPASSAEAQALAEFGRELGLSSPTGTATQ